MITTSICVTSVLIDLVIVSESPNHITVGRMRILVNASLSSSVHFHLLPILYHSVAFPLEEIWQHYREVLPDLGNIYALPETAGAFYETRRIPGYQTLFMNPG